MKIIVAILSVYTLFLTAMPCVDVVKDRIGHATEHSTSSDNHHMPGDDHCSPFCSCQCCATPVVFMDYTVQFDCFPFVQKLLSGYSPSYLSITHIAIWQPPKTA
ncbi:MAG TPA: DUF6660 family protein [Bacteroidales bacterium]|nr:DUF6660 family protein [Bacteroidales bacterium]